MPTGSTRSWLRWHPHPLRLSPPRSGQQPQRRPRLIVVGITASHVIVHDPLGEANLDWHHPGRHRPLLPLQPSELRSPLDGGRRRQRLGCAGQGLKRKHCHRSWEVTLRALALWGLAPGLSSLRPS